MLSNVQNPLFTCFLLPYFLLDTFCKGEKRYVVHKQFRGKFIEDLFSHKFVHVEYQVKRSAQEEQKMISCDIYGSRTLQSYFEKTAKGAGKPKFEVSLVTAKEMKKLIQDCVDFKIANGVDISRKNPYNPLNIFPGTKWCGLGTIAMNDNDLGIYVNTDKCCRTHDKCPDIIKSGAWKYGLKNSAMYTKSHCDCDKQFYECQKNNKDEPSDRVARLYFNYLKARCFKLEYPIIRCLRRKFTACQEYLLDVAKPKRYQVFDAIYFTHPSYTLP